jgi:glycerate 2-kinase
MNAQRRGQLKQIFDAALARVDPRTMVVDTVSVTGSVLAIETETTHEEINLELFQRILVLGAGKASASMALGLEEILGDRIDDGVISVKPGYGEELRRISVVEAGHPVPDEQSQAAARRTLELATEADTSTLVINLISGGGSALLAAPKSCTVDGTTIELSLSDLQTTTEALLGSGATIDEVNTVRKHLSSIKGGGLAKAIYPAHSISLILSDVVGDRLDTIASGPTVADPTTYGDALDLLKRYEVADAVPDSVMRVLTLGADGRIPETPKPGDPVFEPVRNLLVGTNYQALIAASERAEAMGYLPLIVTSQLTGEATTAAGFIASVVRDVQAHGLPVAPPACLLFGGETTVTLRGPGKGGRNQEIALWMIGEMGRRKQDFVNVSFLSAGTDGTDGPTEAAGAFASVGLAESAAESGLVPDEYLARNNSHSFHSGLGSLLLTGPTHTNVCDIQIALVDRPQSRRQA